MSSRFGNNKFKARLGLEERPQNTRTEKKVKGEIPLLVFSFKDFDSNQCPPGQTFQELEKSELLAPLMTKLVALSNKNRVIASQEGSLSTYDSFPTDSDFKKPKFIEGDVQWATIKDVGGQLHRVAGYIEENVFYIVFLDKDHKFYKMKNK